jgi:hypothetical protein
LRPKKNTRLGLSFAVYTRYVQRPCGLILIGTGTMTAPPQVVGLPWYHRDDYPALLLVFSDPDKLPNTFDAWLNTPKVLKSNCRPLAFSSPGPGFVRFRLRHGVGKETYHQISKRDWSLRMKLRGSTTPDRRSVADLKLRLFPDSPCQSARRLIVEPAHRGAT